MLGQRGLRLGRLGGVEIRADVSWFLIVVFVTWSFWDRFGADWGFDEPSSLLMAFAASVLFFGSVLAHEIAHALEARQRGVNVSGITLFLFGGATQTTSEPRRPMDEFALTAVGPFTSLAVAAFFGIVATAADAAGFQRLAAVCGLVGWLNFGLAIFNVLPGAPLDGGRMVRAIAWRVTGDRYKATRIASQCGRVLGALIFALGLFQVFFVSDGLASGMWMAFIGWFLGAAARAELAQAILQERLARVPLRRFAATLGEPIPGDTTVADAIDTWFRLLDGDAFLVSDELGRPAGVLTLDDLRRVKPDARARTRVQDVMRAIDTVPKFDATASAASALDVLTSQGVAVVFEDAEPFGLVTPRRLADAVSHERQLEAALESAR